MLEHYISIIFLEYLHKPPI